MNQNRARPQKRLDPINENIRYPEVQVIGPNGENLGRMSSRRANEIAAGYDLDLYCVAPQANPPVCKILNYGKYRYEKEKSEKENKRKSKAAASELKEIQLHISIGEHDLQTKAKQGKGFLKDGDKVNIRVILKGREMVHKEIGEELMVRFIGLLQEGEAPTQIEKKPSWDGKCYSCIVAPKGKK
ncbi:MAG: translation initiation factor IF-3 [Candidatus Enteromonas sp.]|nr:translation initiation factor IF-3 [Candidatus Enteromonas sp.]